MHGATSDKPLATDGTGVPAPRVAMSEAFRVSGITHRKNFCIIDLVSVSFLTLLHVPKDTRQESPS
jgi:hypothetical protein